LNPYFIDDNSIGNKGAKAIGEALMKNSSLTSLEIGILFMLLTLESII